MVVVQHSFVVETLSRSPNKRWLSLWSNATVHADSLAMVHKCRALDALSCVAEYVHTGMRTITQEMTSIPLVVSVVRCVD